MDVFPLEQGTLLTDRVPSEILVHDEVTECPYINGQIARLPVRLPVRPFELHEFDLRLAKGDRRHGVALYSPDCPSCQACEAIRLPLDTFRFGKTHRRILNRGNRLLRVQLGPPVLSPSRVLLYEKHLHGRGLCMPDQSPMTGSRYRGFIVDRFCESFEIRIFLDERLVGIAITDEGAESLSAHYTFFDPDFPSLSIGTFAILKQIEVARSRNKHYLYLGLYVESNGHMRYKASFHPHERRVAGVWTPIPVGV